MKKCFMTGCVRVGTVIPVVSIPITNLQALPCAVLVGEPICDEHKQAFNLNTVITLDERVVMLEKARERNLTLGWDQAQVSFKPLTFKAHVNGRLPYTQVVETPDA